MITKTYKIVARDQEELDKFSDTISYRLVVGSIVNPQEFVGITSIGRVYDLEEAIDDYNSKFPFLEEPIQLVKCK